MTTRRSFIASILAAGMAPAIGHAGILMPVRKIVVPEVMPVQLGARIAQYERCNLILSKAAFDEETRRMVEREFMYLDSARRVNVLQREMGPV